MSWKDSIASCFGPSDRAFLSHPLEKQRAEALREELVRQNVTRGKFEEAVEGWLKSVVNWTPELIHEEVIKVGEWFFQSTKKKSTKMPGAGPQRPPFRPRKPS